MMNFTVLDLFYLPLVSTIFPSQIRFTFGSYGSPTRVFTGFSNLVSFHHILDSLECRDQDDRGSSVV